MKLPDKNKKLMRVFQISILCIFISSLVACINQSSPLSPADEQDRQHFMEATEKANEWATFSNALTEKTQGGTKPLSENDINEVKEHLPLLKSAIDHARSVSDSFLERVHPELKMKWHVHKIGGMEGEYRYLDLAFYHPEKIQDLSLSELDQLNGHYIRAFTSMTAWWDWSEENHKQLEEGIKNLAPH